MLYLNNFSIKDEKGLLKVRKLNHLYEIHKFYDTFVIDLWGVMHNGIELNSKAIEAVDNLIKNNKKVVFYQMHPVQAQK